LGGSNKLIRLATRSASCGSPDLIYIPVEDDLGQQGAFYHATEMGWFCGSRRDFYYGNLYSYSELHAGSGQEPLGRGLFPNVTLTTQDGKQVHFYDDVLKGKIVVIDLIYTHCVNACPLETARLVQVQKMLGDRVGKDIFFYSISIDPENDTPKVLKITRVNFMLVRGGLF